MVGPADAGDLRAMQGFYHEPGVFSVTERTSAWLGNHQSDVPNSQCEAMNPVV